ncbi:MAG: hypothetical protein Q9228_001073 [Teloschistes exilis]
MEIEAYVLRFWFKPEASGVIKHLKWFSYRVSNNLGILSQYKDPRTGESTLQRVQEAPTIDTVGDGIYCKTDGKSYSKLDRRETFLIGQAELLSRQLKKNANPHKNTLFHMIDDLRVRKPICHEDDVVDTDPFATAEEQVKNCKTRRQRMDIVQRNLTSVLKMQAPTDR